MQTFIFHYLFGHVLGFYPIERRVSLEPEPGSRIKSFWILPEIPVYDMRKKEHFCRNITIKVGQLCQIRTISSKF
jgi:hypothetical protein